MQRREPPDYSKLAEALPKFEDWSNLAARNTDVTVDKGVAALRAFVEGGGTLIALPGECEKVVRHFDLPVEVGVYVDDDKGERRKAQREEFYIPGSLLALDVDVAHPIARGAPANMAAMFRGGCEVLTPTGAGAEVIARYRASDTLLSGWAIGEELLHGKAAALVVRVGKGRVVLFGCDALYRGQPLTTARLVLQAALTAGER
jgi:hypothetical protein